jgi:hypothetical protein
MMFGAEFFAFFGPCLLFIGKTAFFTNIEGEPLFFYLFHHDS